MSKTAKAALEKPLNDAIQEAIQEAKADSDLNFLKRQKEEKIRMKLDQFARELSQVKKQRARVKKHRDQHQVARPKESQRLLR